MSAASPACAYYGWRNNADDGPTTMNRSGRDIASIVLAIFVALMVVLALYFFLFAVSSPTARPPL
jgi:hypothetical protein